ALINGISMSETLSEHALALLKECMWSSENCKDFSPNMCAVHFYTYYKAKKLNPFYRLDKKLGSQFSEELEIYYISLNKIEQSIFMSKEMEIELIAFLKTEPEIDLLLLDERKKELEKGERGRQVINVDPSKTRQEKITVTADLASCRLSDA